MNLKNCCKTIFMATPVRFEGLWQRHQSIANEFSNLGFNVLYLQPLKSGGFSASVSYVKNNIKAINCKIPFKASSYPGLNKIAVKFALMLLKKKLNLISEQTFLWLSEPSLAFLCSLNWKKAIYDRCDLHGCFPGQNKLTWKKYEDYIFKNCDLCVVSHKYLKNNIPDGLKTIIVKNAASGDFAAGYKKHNADNSVLRLVSSGAHYEWIDFKWLRLLLGIHNVELHIVGSGRGKEFNRLINEDKVVFHGEMPHEKLKAFLQTCDVGLVPFKDIELIKGVDPIKVYEYAALGLEVWANDIKPLHGNEFINRFINKNTPLKAITDKNRLHLAIPTWENRMKPVLPYLL